MGWPGQSPFNGVRHYKGWLGSRALNDVCHYNSNNSLRSATKSKKEIIIIIITTTTLNKNKSFKKIKNKIKHIETVHSPVFVYFFDLTS